MSHESQEILKSVPISDNALTDYMRSVRKVDTLTAEEEIQFAHAIEVGLLANEQLQLHEDTLSLEEKVDLTILVGYGLDANEQMVYANMPLVVSRARSRYRGGVDMMDLIQGGFEGLRQAVVMFDYKLGNKLSTYATRKIDTAIDETIARSRPAMSIPPAVLLKMRTIEVTRVHFLQASGRYPTRSELAEESGLEMQEIDALLRVETAFVSFDMPVGDKEESLGALVNLRGNDKRGEDIAYELVRSAKIEEKLSVLNEDESTILKLSYGMGSEGALETNQIARLLDKTPDRVRALREFALSKLKHPAMGMHQIDHTRSHETWRDDALCLEIGVDAFFPEEQKGSEAAKSVCEECDVREQCLNFALTTKQHQGVWGGTGTIERRSLMNGTAEQRL